MVEKLLTVADIAQQLGLSEAEVTRLAEQGDLRAMRLGGELLRFHPQDVAAWRAARPPPRPGGDEGARHVPPSRWWEPWAEFLYAYDFYLAAALLLAVIVVAIFVTRS